MLREVRQEGMGRRAYRSDLLNGVLISFQDGYSVVFGHGLNKDMDRRGPAYVFDASRLEESKICETLEV